jgi:hypothetical protein
MTQTGAYQVAGAPSASSSRGPPRFKHQHWRGRSAEAVSFTLQLAVHSSWPLCWCLQRICSVTPGGDAASSWTVTCRSYLHLLEAV